MESEYLSEWAYYAMLARETHWMMMAAKLEYRDSGDPRFQTLYFAAQIVRDAYMGRARVEKADHKAMVN